MKWNLYVQVVRFSKRPHYLCNCGRTCMWSTSRLYCLVALWSKTLCRSLNALLVQFVISFWLCSFCVFVFHNCVLSAALQQRTFHVPSCTYALLVYIRIHLSITVMSFKSLNKFSACHRNQIIVLFSCSSLNFYFILHSFILKKRISE